MENVELGIHPDALDAIATKAIERKTGARGSALDHGERSCSRPCSTCPASTASRKWSFRSEVVEGKARPLYIYSDRREDVGSTA